MSTTPAIKPEEKPVRTGSETLVPAVVEQPSEQQVTEAYLEKRAKGETENLPTPEPVIKAAVVEEEKPTDTDTYIAERSERKRKERGGKAARIDELTKEKAELAKQKEELEAKLKAEADAKTTKPLEPKPDTPPKPAEPLPKAKPKMNEFTDIDEYHAAMALWAADERARANGGVTAAKEPEQAVQIAKIRKEEFDNFLEKGRRFVAGHPDFNETLDAAHVRGLTMSEAARTAITRFAVPEVVYWLARPENDLAARKLMEMDELQQVVEVGRIAERLKVSPSDFVSNAPQPGIRLPGTAHVEEVPLNQITDTDTYIQQRYPRKFRGARSR